MGATTLLLHRAHLLGCMRARCAFAAALQDPERVQRERLRRILAVVAWAPHWAPLGLDGTYERFRSRVEPVDYSMLQPLLERQKRSGEAVLGPGTARWQPTSGSTAGRKWFPYPPAFRHELDAAAGAWLADLARQRPGAFAGRHYWSLSWLPEDLRRAGLHSDDLELLPAWKRWVLRRTMAVPAGVERLPRSEDARLATLVGLAAVSDLSLLSVWSPTFALALLRDLSERRAEVAATLHRGTFPDGRRAPHDPARARLLDTWNGSIDTAFLERLWPSLQVISAWDSAASAAPAAQLRVLLPRALLQGKGLWATEGVVSVPFEERLPLALTSHFLEFRCLQTGRIHPAWELQEGQQLQPLLSTSAGLLRYPLEDRVEVRGFLARTAWIAFLGRLGGTDLVGEKLGAEWVGDLLGGLARDQGIACPTLFAVPGPRPRYVLLAEGPATPDLAVDLEAALGHQHHYRLARELGQLEPATVAFTADAARWLAARARHRGQSDGEWKVQALETWDLQQSPERFDPS